MDEYHVDEGSASSIVSYMQEQRGVIPDIPTDKQALIEGYIDVKGNRNLIFHFCFGRRVNDALSRAYAYALSEKLKCNVAARITDDNFMLTVPKRVSLEGIENLVTSDNIEELLRGAIKNTELFKQRFRHCATRSFIVLRSYKGREVTVGRQQLRSQRVLDWFHEIEDFPAIKETYNEILNEVMDLDNAKEVVKKIEKALELMKQSIKESQKVNDQTLDKLHPDLSKHYREEFSEGLKLYVNFLEDGGVSKEKKAKHLLDKWGTWFLFEFDMMSNRSKWLLNEFAKRQDEILFPD